MILTKIERFVLCVTACITILACFGNSVQSRRHHFSSAHGRFRRSLKRRSAARSSSHTFQNSLYAADNSSMIPFINALPVDVNMTEYNTTKSYANSSMSSAKSRRKRSTFAWPDGAIFIMQFSLEMPLEAPEGVSSPLLVEVPYEFELPNVTNKFFFLDDEFGRSYSTNVAKDKVSVLSTVRSLFQRFGFDGHSCVLRAVCERAETDVYSHGLLGEVLNMILAVSSSGANSADLHEFLEAENIGKTEGDCRGKYSKCPMSIFNIFD